MWVTLTYKKISRDERRVYEDFPPFLAAGFDTISKSMNTNLRNISQQQNHKVGRMAFALPLSVPEKAPFIPNADMARIWGHGFTKTKSLQGIDNPGLYLTAYLGDMELSETLRVGNAKGQIAEAEITDEQGKHRKKAIIKGARLHLYPPALICIGQAGV